MRIYVSVGDKNVEQWIQSVLPKDSNTWARSASQADLVVTAKLAEAKKVEDPAVAVLVAAAGPSAERAKQQGIENIVIVPEQGIYAVALLQSLMPFLFAEAPIIHAISEPYRIKIVSSRQSGGTFIAWNLLKVLQSNGIPAKLATVNPNSVLSHWVQGADPDIVYGYGINKPQNTLWQIIDATDIGSANPEDIESDATILVKDCDTGKPLPSVKNSWVIMNRVPLDYEVPSNIGFNVMVEDLGGMAYRAIANSNPVVSSHPQFSEVLTQLWRAIQREDHEFKADVFFPDQEETKVQEPVYFHDQVEKQQEPTSENIEEVSEQVPPILDIALSDDVSNAFEFDD